MTITPRKMITETKDKEVWLEGILYKYDYSIDLSQISNEDKEALERFLESLSEYFDNINYVLGEGEV